MTNAATGLVPNEVAHGVCVNANINLLRDLTPQDYEKLWLLKPKAAGEAIAFTNAITKAHYDSKYTPLNPKKRDKTYLRLHHGYGVPGQENRKLHRQRVGPFHTLGKVGNRAYKLDLPHIVKICPVVAVAQFESVPKGEDPHRRPRPTTRGPVVDEDRRPDSVSFPGI